MRANPANTVIAMAIAMTVKKRCSIVRPCSGAEAGNPPQWTVSVSEPLPSKVMSQIWAAGIGAARARRRTSALAMDHAAP